MRCTCLLLLLLSAAVSAAAADRPSWVGEAGRGALFPEPRWLSATAEERTTAERDRAATLAIVATAAQNELARSVRVRVEAVTESRTMEVGGTSGARFETSFSDQSLTITGVSLDLRRLETWFDEVSGTAYAIAAVERPVLAAAFRARGAESLTLAQAVADEAAAHQAAGRANAATPVWAAALAAMRGTVDDLVLARGLAATPEDEALAARLAELHARISQAQAALAGRVIASLDDLVWVLAGQLARGAGEARPTALVPAFTVRSSRLSSPFGRQAAGLLAVELGRTAGWSVAREVVGTPAREAASATGAEVVVLGSTWDQPDGVRVMASAHRLADGRLVAAAEAVLPAAALAATGLATAPQNAATALADQQAFSNEEVIGGGMRLEVWTSKGDDVPVFLKGEIVQIFVRVDRPCHLRLIYHLADGRRALLVDNLFIDETKVNLVYQLPDEFEVAAPFGAETLQASAATQPFPRLVTRLEDGYPIITEALASANAKTRGLKRAKPQARQAEARVVVTTVER